MRNEVDEKEINKTIAEFMGWNVSGLKPQFDVSENCIKWCDDSYGKVLIVTPDFCEDLTSLPGVFEVLNYHAFRWDHLGKNGYSVCLSYDGDKKYGRAKKLSKAAALSAYKAIKELRDSREG